MKAKKLAIWAALLCTYLIWGSTYLANRFCLESLPPFLVAAFRFLVAGGILFAWRHLAGDHPPTTNQWRSAAIVGFFLLLGGSGGVIWAQQRVDSGIAALLVGSSPLWIVLIDGGADILSHRAFRSGGASVVGIVLGFAGIGFLVWPLSPTSTMGRVDLVGAGVLTLAAISWAVGSLFNRSADLPASPIQGIAMEMLCGGAMLLIASLLAGEANAVHLNAISIRSGIGLAYLTVAGSIMGYSAYLWLLRVASIPLVSTSAYVNPIVAVLLGNLIAAEPFTPQLIITTGVIVGAVVLTSMQPRPPKRQDAQLIGMNTHAG